MGKPTYVGVFLDLSSRNLLLERVRPIHPKVFADHLTLAFGKEVQGPYSLGLKVEMEVHAVAADEKGQAVVVARKSVEQLGMVRHQHPHITISCAEKAAPVYSNLLLAECFSKPELLTKLEPPLVLTGVLDYFPRTCDSPSP